MSNISSLIVIDTGPFFLNLRLHNPFYTLVGSTDQLMFIKAHDLSMTAVPVGSTGDIAFTADGLKAYTAVNGKPQVAVIQIGAQVHALHIPRRNRADQTLLLAITGVSDLDAKSIDPASLRLEGVPARTDSSGPLAPSIELLTGFHAHSLIVHFKIDAAKAASKMTLVGKTYSGMPVRATVDAN